MYIHTYIYVYIHIHMRKRERKCGSVCVRAHESKRVHVRTTARARARETWAGVALTWAGVKAKCIQHMTGPDEQRGRWVVGKGNKGKKTQHMEHGAGRAK